MGITFWDRIYHRYHPNATITNSWPANNWLLEKFQGLTLLSLPSNSNTYSLAIMLHMSNNSTENLLPSGKPIRGSFRVISNDTRIRDGTCTSCICWRSASAFARDCKTKVIQTVKIREYRLNALLLKLNQNPKWFMYFQYNLTMTTKPT